MKASFRVLYRQLILILSCCLLATTLTGIILGLSYRLIQLPDPVIAILIGLHQGMFLGGKISPIYVLFMGLGVFVLSLKTIVEGKYNLLFQSAPPTVANVLRIIVLILVIPLAVCVQTGVAYRLGKDWFGIPNEDTTRFLSVHGGSSFGTVLGALYLFVVGVGLITLLILSRKSNKTSTKKIRQTLQQHLKTTNMSRNFPTKKIVLGNKSKLAIIYGLIALLGILYYMTSAMFVAVAVMVIVAILSVVLLGKNFTGTKSSQGYQEKKQTLSISHQQEAESITMLRAIPDSMLRVSKGGICLSYIPAKEPTSFILYGNIVNKHIREFLAPEIAEQFMVSVQSSLETGSTNICRFPISIDSEKQHYEARVSPIGDSEVLILVREIPDFGYSSVVAENLFVKNSNTIIQPLIESEFSQVLETILSNSKQRNHILLCLAMDPRSSNGKVAVIDDNLIFQIATQVNSLLPSSIISRLDDNNLTILVSDRTIETASILVEDLRLNLDQLLDAWQQKTSSSIEFNIGLIEVDSDDSDAASLIDDAKAACKMAKRKVHFKTF